MLCDINSQECKELMKLIETQSKATLGNWAVGFAKEQYLPIYRKQAPEDKRLEEVVSACEEYLAGTRTLKDLKPLLREGRLIAQEAEKDPVAQAAARAVSTGCAAITTPTNALGFLFYGSAAAAYTSAGLTESAEVYDALAAKELRKALADLRENAVPDEENPVKIQWNC